MRVTLGPAFPPKPSPPTRRRTMSKAARSSKGCVVAFKTISGWLRGNMTLANMTWWQIFMLWLDINLAMFLLSLMRPV